MDIACKYNGVVCFGGNVFNLLLIYLCKIVCELLSLFMPPTFSSSTSEYGIYLFPNTQLFFPSQIQPCAIVPFIVVSVLKCYC